MLDCDPKPQVFPVLCGYQLHDFWCSQGAVMVHVARLDDLKSEFTLQMVQRTRDGFFGKYPPRGWDLLWYRTRDYPSRYV